jgi:hypothetical protein
MYVCMYMYVNLDLGLVSNSKGINAIKVVFACVCVCSGGQLRPKMIHAQMGTY